MSNRYSFTGKGRVLLRTIGAGTYAGKEYEANEPLALFEDVLVDIAFSTIDKVAKKGVDNLTASNENAPSFLRIENIQNTDSIQTLLYQVKTTNANHKTEARVLTSMGGNMYLPLGDSEVLLPNVFVYSATKVKQTGFLIDTEVNAVTGLPDGNYSVFYNVNRAVTTTYSLESPSIPYVAAEIQIIGNLNNTTGEMVMHLNNLKLLTRPTLDFNSTTPFVTSLEFAIMSRKDEAEVNYYG